jgi:orotate phosphoribosyltransferase
MDRKQLAIEIFRVSHLTGTFELRSGAISNEYFDKYRFESIPGLLFEIAKHIADSIDFEYDILAGLEMGGIPLATAISSITGKPCVFVRKKAKEYGTKKLAEGPEIKGKRLLIVEDVITSGGQVIISTNDLRDMGGIITNTVCVIDRESGGRQKLEEAGLNLTSLFTMSRIKEFSVS